MGIVAGLDSSPEFTRIVVCDADTGAVLRQGYAPHPVEGSDGAGRPSDVDPQAWLLSLGEAAGGGLLEGVQAIGVSAQQNAIVPLDAQGNTLAVSARFEDGSAVGVSGLPDEVLSDAGAAFLFERSPADGQWTEARYVKAPNPGTDDRFGGTFLRGAIALSADGDTLIVPAADDDGLKDATLDSGAVYLY